MSKSQTLGELIRSERKKLGIDQPELSRQTEIDQARISRIENNKMKIIDYRMMYKLRKALNISEDQLPGINTDFYDDDDISVRFSLNKETYKRLLDTIHYVFEYIRFIPDPSGKQYVVDDYPEDVLVALIMKKYFSENSNANSEQILESIKEIQKINNKN